MKRRWSLLWMLWLCVLALTTGCDSGSSINPIPSTTVTVTGPDEVNIGDTITLTAATSPTQTVTWSSSDEAIATINSNGVVTGVTAGTATITATATDGSDITATHAVTVKASATPPATTITISGDSEVIVDQSITLTATTSPTQTVIWSSSDEAIATVNSDGVVTGVAAGEITITATADDGTKDTHNIEVLALTPAEIIVTIISENNEPGVKDRYVWAGETITLDADVTPSQAVTWSSSDDNIATIDPNSGEVTGVLVDSDGTTRLYETADVEVTATADDGTEATFTVTVRPPELILTVDATSSLDAAIPIFGTGSYDLTVKWGDGSDPVTITTGISSSNPKHHTYSASGSYDIAITANDLTFGADKSWGSQGLAMDYDGYSLTPIVAIKSFGKAKFINNPYTFASDWALEMPAHDLDTPYLEGDLNHMFTGNTSFDSNVSHWDVSKVTDMTNMFSGSAFNQDLSSWNVASVTNMSYMFSYNAAFNQDLSGWDLASVTNMEGMFEGAEAFNQDVSTWDVTNVTIMDYMFYGASEFDNGGQSMDNTVNPDAHPSWNEKGTLAPTNMFLDSAIDSSGNGPSWY